MANNQELAAEIRRELRSIRRQRDEWRRPLEKFEPNPNANSGQPPHYVMFDMRRRRCINGLRIGIKCLQLPDERILDGVYRLAESVWHLKDRLKTWGQAQGLDLNVESHAASAGSLLIVADLANMKKHGELLRPRSNRSPRLGVLRHDENGRADKEGSGLVSFDTSNSGVVEVFYDGSRKDKELLVTHAVPIPFKVEVLVDDGGTSLGNAVDFIYSAFREWLPIIDDAGVLSDGDRESEELLKGLRAADG